MTQAPTEKQTKYLALCIQKARRGHDTNALLDQAAAQNFGLESWEEAPISKKVCSCLIDIFLGKADIGLYVWAVRQELEIAA